MADIQSCPVYYHTDDLHLRRISYISVTAYTADQNIHGVIQYYIYILYLHVPTHLWRYINAYIKWNIQLDGSFCAQLLKILPHIIDILWILPQLAFKIMLYGFKTWVRSLFCLSPLEMKQCLVFITYHSICLWWG